MVPKQKKAFHGWAVFVGCLILMIFPGGLISCTVGLFMYPICGEFGFSTTVYSLALTLSGAVNALVSAFLAGYLSRGSRKTMNLIMGLSVVSVCGGFAAQSFCSTLWQFYGMAILWNIGYNMLTFIPVTMLISNWFVKKRELLTGIAIAFSNVGGAIFNTVISKIIEVKGWRTAYIFGGIISMVPCLIAVIFLIKRSPAEYGEEAYGSGELAETGQSDEVWKGVDKRIALKQPAFYALCATMFLTGIYGAGVCNHAVNYLCTTGWEVSAAGVVMTVFTLAGIVGSTAGGSLLGKIGYKKTILIGGGVALMAMVSLILAENIPVIAYVFAVLLGLCCFMVGLLPSMSVSNTFGLKDYADIYGITYAFYLVGCAVSAPAIALIAENLGYLVAWVAVIVFIILVVLLHMFCIGEGYKLKQQYPNQ